MQKTFVLDTNVLLIDPMAIFKFDNNIVHIPLIVIEELDRFKSGQDEKARNARQFSRTVDELRAKGSLTKGVKLDNGGELIVSAFDRTAFQNKCSNVFLDFKCNDNIILATAMLQGSDAIVVSKDINVRIKADALGVPAEDYKAQNVVSKKDLYRGHRLVKISSAAITKFRDKGVIKATYLANETFYPNEYFLLENKTNEKDRILCRYDSALKTPVMIEQFKEGVFGIVAKNMEQHFALDSLMNDNVKLINLMGKAGTGKTLLAVAAGLEKVMTEQKYKKLLVARPVVPMGKDLGYLPGDINEKLAPWMQPIMDNLEHIFGGKKGEAERLMDCGMLQVEALTYIRGRSIPNQFMIIDEAQNLTPHEIKTIISRAGEGTKIILTGDTQQIDNPYLHEGDNGLAYALNKMRPADITADVTLKQGERSELAELATKLL